MRMTRSKRGHHGWYDIMRRWTPGCPPRPGGEGAGVVGGGRESKPEGICPGKPLGRCTRTSSGTPPGPSTTCTTGASLASLASGASPLGVVAVPASRSFGKRGEEEAAPGWVLGEGGAAAAASPSLTAASQTAASLTAATSTAAAVASANACAPWSSRRTPGFGVCSVVSEVVRCG